MGFFQGVQGSRVHERITGALQSITGVLTGILVNLEAFQGLKRYQGFWSGFKHTENKLTSFF